MWKKPFFFIIFFLILSFAYAVSNGILPFSTETTSELLNFTGNQNHTLFVDFPMNHYVSNVTINLQGQASAE